MLRNPERVDPRDALGATFFPVVRLLLCAQRSTERLPSDYPAQPSCDGIGR